MTQLPDSYPHTDNRQEIRRKARLRPIKLISREKRFLEDGSVVNLSRSGVRVRRYGSRSLPPCLTLFDEIEGTMRNAVIVWKSHSELGLSFVAEPQRMTRAERARLGGRYYAL